MLTRLIQEEKQSTEARAEQLENRVGGGGGGLDHHILRPPGRPPLPLDASPPLSGRSTPNALLQQPPHSPQRDYVHQYHNVGLTDGGQVVGGLLPDGSPPTPRSHRLGPPPGGVMGPHPPPSLAVATEDQRRYTPVPDMGGNMYQPYQTYSPG